MNLIEERFSRETGKIEKYEQIFLKESIVIKGEEFKVEHEYYKRLSDGQLFEPFDNPDKNLEKDYKIYRKKYNLLSPQQIKKIRNTYKLSVRDFATVLGISYGNLSSIENGSIQAKYIDSLLRLSSDPYAFKKLVEGRKNELSSDVYSRLMELLHTLILDSLIERNKQPSRVHN